LRQFKQSIRKLMAKQLYLIIKAYSAEAANQTAINGQE
jgi:hypothetical protein